MNAEIVDKIKELVPAQIVTLGGKEFATAEVFNAPLPVEPMAAFLCVSTLTGLVDYARAFIKVQADHVIHVRSYHEAALLTSIKGEKRQRENFITSDCGKSAFRFGQFIPHAEFMIGIQSMFADYGDRSKVMKVCGTIREDMAKTSNDDGITQKVTASAGIALSQEVALPNPVILKPFRTFTEIDQPPSMFVLRVQSAKEGLPLVALFEADGGRWKAEAILAIRDYLVSAALNIPIIA